jgi:hypothetical protein
LEQRQALGLRQRLAFEVVAEFPSSRTGADEALPAPMASAGPRITFAARHSGKSEVRAKSAQRHQDGMYRLSKRDDDGRILVARLAGQPPEPTRLNPAQHARLRSSGRRINWTAGSRPSSAAASRMAGLLFADTWPFLA